MDLGKVIRDLYTEKEKLERTIATLEQLSQAGTTLPANPKRRGRHAMGAIEREDVSQRMKRYWAGRRARKNGDGSAGPDIIQHP
jgi:hypothetical protein